LVRSQPTGLSLWLTFWYCKGYCWDFECNGKRYDRTWDGFSGTSLGCRFNYAQEQHPLTTLKNADSTTIKNGLLKNADSTTMKNGLLKNADSTTIKNGF